MIYPKIVESQQSPSWMNMTYVILKWNEHQKQIQNLTNKLQIFSDLSTLQTSRKVNSHNTNPWTTVQAVHFILTMTNLQLGGCRNASYWPKSLQREDSQCDCAHIANPHPHQQWCISHNQQRDQEDCFGWLQVIAAVWLSSYKASIQTFGGL